MWPALNRKPLSERKTGMRIRHAAAWAAVALLAAGAAAQGPGAGAGPAWTEEQLQADWMVQARLSPENLRALAKRDAAGVMDGIRGPQGDHATIPENWTWWEVDLRAVVPLDRVEVFNPQANRGRNAWFKVLVAQRKDEFHEVHQMEGPSWQKGHLVVSLGGRPARWVRLSAGGRDRLRLSEVEVYGTGDPTVNLAPRGVADQSSYQARRQAQGSGHKAPPPQTGPVPMAAEIEQDYPLVYVPTDETIARGAAPAAAMEPLGVDVAADRKTLADLARRRAALPAKAAAADHLAVYLDARRAIRALAFRNPLLSGCERLLFIKRVPGSATSTGPQFNSEYLRPGGGIHVLEGLRSGKPTVRNLTADFPPGNFTGLDLSRDGTRILFAYARHCPEVSAARHPVAKEARPTVGFVSYDAGKFVLGTVPVERDGSAHFVAPAGVPLWFQALGEDGRAIQTMRSATYLQGGEMQACIGCHERRTDTPSNYAVLAARRSASRIRLDVEGSWPFRFDRLVQPTLDRLLAAKDPKVADLDLVPTREWKNLKISKPGITRGTAETYMWHVLVNYGGEKSLFDTNWRQNDGTGFSPSVPGQGLATITPLWESLTAPRGLPLTADEKAKLALWMDMYGQYAGHFTAEQEAPIAALREKWAFLLEPPAAEP